MLLALTGCLYKWIGLSSMSVAIDQEEMKKDKRNESTHSESMHSFEFQEVPTHGQKITDFGYSRRRNNPVCFLSNEKGEVFYTKTAGSGTHNDVLMSPQM